MTANEIGEALSAPDVAILSEDLACADRVAPGLGASRFGNAVLGRTNLGGAMAAAGSRFAHDG